LVTLLEGTWYVTVRCRHDRGDMGPSNSSAGLFVPLDEGGGISILSGRSVFVVEALDAAILSVSIGISVATVQQLKWC